MSAEQHKTVDVVALVEELKERAAEERAAGAYADDLSDVELTPPPPPPEAGSPSIEGFDLQTPGPRIQFRPELGFSSKPVIGPVITLVKRFFLRLLFYVFDDLARQADIAITRVEGALTVEAGARQAVAKDVRGLEAFTTAIEARARVETGLRESIQGDLHSLAERLSRLETDLAGLQLKSRLARLERERRPSPQVEVVNVGLGAGEPTPTVAAFDYEMFEARFRSEESVRERQQIYVDLLQDRKRVVDLGCGRGELIELLGEQGVSAYGVEIDPDFVELLRERGVEVVVQDAVAHLDSLEPGAVDAVVASHLIEHLGAPALTRLVTLAAEKLPESGVLILETPNPESLVAGSVNFHRDLTHVRPIHPDTLVFLCESAGFAEVDVRRLMPVPENERLPKPGDGKVDVVVDQLNELIYGFQDYSVIARRG
jgi:SAM-dependent methyltransferase